MGTQAAPLLRRSSGGGKSGMPVANALLASRVSVSGARGQQRAVGADWQGRLLQGQLLQRQLLVGSVSDPLEAEAEQIAERVMSVSKPASDVRPAAARSPGLQRCSCGSCSKCGGEDEVMHRSPNGASPSPVMQAPPVVQDVLASPGQPIDAGLRGFLEPRFGGDFSRVRVHTDARAAESANSVSAAAYTVGDHIVFGPGRYSPNSDGTRRLLAHELVHTLQQGGEERTVQRACLPAADCAAPRATLPGFVAATEAEPENVRRAEKRKKDCTATPRKASCTSDGHGAKAAALMNVMKAHAPSRLGFVTGVFVDKDIPAAYGAVTRDCANFMPPLPGGKCTFVPDRLEKQAQAFQSGAAAIGASSREEWLTATVGTLTHETEHARFDTGPGLPAGPKGSCKFADLQSNLSEMSAHFAEMHTFYRAALARPEKDRFKRFEQMFDFWVKNGSEDISGIVKEVRCRCDCDDADHFLKKTVEGVESSQRWDTFEHFKVHTELRNPKWKLNWPVDPGTVNVSDIPQSKAAPLKYE